MSTTPREAGSHLLHTNIDAALAQFERIRCLEEPLNEAADLVMAALQVGGKLLICGNGGSAADAAHLATEFVVRYRHDRQPLPAISLSDAGSTLTAIGNDYQYKDVFARQVRAFGRPGDVLIVITTSGVSPSVLAALEVANEMKLTSIALLGRDGGPARGLATLDLIVAGDDTGRIQEAQKLLYHTLCEMVELRVIDSAQ